MAFSRNSLVAAVAGSLSLAMLTGCPNPANNNNLGASPSPSTGATTAPSSPTASASTSTTPSTTPSGAATPTAVPSASPLSATTLRGTVYDITGGTLDGATITVTSLNPSSPFTTSVTSASGAYVANGVPAGVQIQITVTKTGYTSRTRVVTLLPLASSQSQQVDFGGPGGSADPSGPAYFVSQYLEVSSVTPADQAQNVDPTQLTYKLTLSQALDSTNQARFARALRVLPANNVAAPNFPSGQTVPNFRDSVPASSVGNALDTQFTASSLYEIKQGSWFLDPNTGANVNVTWDATGTVATMTFAAPLQTSSTNTPTYQLLLVNSDGNAIQTPNSYALGEDYNTLAGSGSLGGTYVQGHVIGAAFLNPSLAVSTPANGSNKDSVWAQTHLNAVKFSLAEDNTPPTLTGASVSQVGNEHRILLTFSKPMAAYGNGSLNANYSSTLVNPANYKFVFGNTTADVNGVTLNSSAAIASSGVQTFASIGNNSASDSTLKSVTTFATAAGKLTMDIAPNDPKTVRLYTTGTNPTDLFGTYAHNMAVWVAGVQDPAGNSITTSSADANVKTASF